MAKTKFSGGIKGGVSEKVRSRIPRAFDDIFMLKLEDAEEGNAERVINDLEVTGYVVIKSITVESTAVVNNGEVLRINGDIDIPLQDETEVNLFERTFTNKDEAIEVWKDFMYQKVKAATAKAEAYAKLVGFLNNQLKEENY